MLYEFAIPVALGAGCMFISTISGGGSNVILIPILILGFHFNPGEAIGTSFLALTSGSLVSGMTFFRKGYVSVKKGSLLGLASIPGVLAGSIFSYQADKRAFGILLGFVVIALAVLMILYPRLIARQSKAIHQKDPEHAVVQHSQVDLRTSSILVAGIGFFVGFFGQGGGLVLTPLLQFLGFPILVSLGTARLISIFIGGSALVTRLAVEQVNITFGIALAIGTMIGGFLGVEFSSKLRTEIVKWVVASIIVILGSLLIVAPI